MYPNRLLVCSRPNPSFIVHQLATVLVAVFSNEKLTFMNAETDDKWRKVHASEWFWTFLFKQYQGACRALMQNRTTREKILDVLKQSLVKLMTWKVFSFWNFENTSYLHHFSLLTMKNDGDPVLGIKLTSAWCPKPGLNFSIYVITCSLVFSIRGEVKNQ